MNPAVLEGVQHVAGVLAGVPEAGAAMRRYRVWRIGPDCWFTSTPEHESFGPFSWERALRLAFKLAAARRGAEER